MSVSFSTILQRARPSPAHNVGNQLREAINKIPETVTAALPNGVRVGVEQYQSNFATICLGIKAGSRNDLNAGTAQMLEAINTNATTHLDNPKLAAAVEELGGQFNVETSRDRTTYLLKVRKENTAKGIALLADMVRNGRLNDSDIETARKAVQYRRNTFDEDRDALLLDQFHVAAYDSSNTGLGSPLMGTEDGINAVGKHELADFRSYNYTADKIVLGVTGGVDPKAVETAAAQHFGDVPREPTSNTRLSDKFPATRWVGGDIKLWNIRNRMQHVAFGVETCGYNCGDSIALKLANVMLGHKSHRTQHELAPTHALRTLKVFSSMDHGAGAPIMSTPFPAESIETADAVFQQYEDTGFIGHKFTQRLWETTHHEADVLRTTTQWLMTEYTRITQKAIGHQEFDQAKVVLKSQALFDRDGATNSAKDIVNQLINHNRRIPVTEVYNRIDDLDSNNLMEVLQHYYYARRPVISYIGNMEAAPAYDSVQMWTWRTWY